jgi:hypothetical protein
VVRQLYLSLTGSWSCFKIKHVWEGLGKHGILYGWQQISLFVTWNLEDDMEIVLLPTEGNTQHLHKDLEKCLEIYHRDPYECHSVFAEEVRKLYDDSVWSLRDLIRKTEKVCSGHFHCQDKPGD